MVIVKIQVHFLASDSDGYRALKVVKKNNQQVLGMFDYWLGSSETLPH